ncbi:MAG: glycoside hydrolase family 15 protein [Acidimicrobiales bacterium]
MGDRDTASADDYLPLEQYGLIGDCGSAALVSNRASIDWLCLPRFESDPVFARLLDPSAGSFGITPQERSDTTRRYLSGTAVLATSFVTSSGRATVYDFFAARPGPAKRRALWPFRYLVRRVEVEEGVVRLEAVLRPSQAFGFHRLRLLRGEHRLVAPRKGQSLLCESSARWQIVDGSARASFELRAGERTYFALAFAERDLGVLPPVSAFAEEAFHETVAYWRAWEGVAPTAPSLHPAVLRSALTIKLLTYAPSGAVVAAPTTSLPESIGGVRNWDYRYAWIRDSSWSVAALFDLGHTEAARAFLIWAANASRLSLPKVRTVYGLYGNVKLRERELSQLRGYRDSRPVRVGNAAANQLQLDNWGHLVDAASQYAERTGALDKATWSSLRALIDFVAHNWHLPDQGIWEVRGEPRHFVHSKVMCWVALDRGLRLARDFGLTAPVERWANAAKEVRSAVLTKGVDPRHGNLVRAFGDDEVDAALLLVPVVGFLPGSDPRIKKTIERVRHELGSSDLIRRYRADDGLPGSEGAFLPCSFWLAHALALAGEHAEACDVFEAACTRANDLGLLPEEIDSETGAFLGNFPQALSHIALIQAALALERTRGRTAGAEGD